MQKIRFLPVKFQRRSHYSDSTLLQLFELLLMLMQIEFTDARKIRNGCERERKFSLCKKLAIFTLLFLALLTQNLLRLFTLFLFRPRKDDTQLDILLSAFPNDCKHSKNGFLASSNLWKAVNKRAYARMGFKPFRYS